MLPPLRQLLELTLVAAVFTLLALPLLNLVNALELPEELIELRQLLDAIDDALDANRPPLRVLEGETARWLRSEAEAETECCPDPEMDDADADEGGGALGFANDDVQLAVLALS